MTGIYDAVWRSLTSLYLDHMSPDQHLAVMITTAITIVAVVIGACWTYGYRRGSADDSADSTVNVQANGNSPSTHVFSSSSSRIIIHAVYG